MGANSYSNSAISMTSHFSILKKAPDVDRQLYKTVEEMVAMPEMYLANVYEANIEQDYVDATTGDVIYPAGTRFRFMRSLPESERDPLLGKWRPTGGTVDIIDDLSTKSLDKTWSCKKLYGLIGDFDNIEMYVLHDLLNPMYNPVSDPTNIPVGGREDAEEPYYDPDNPLYYHGVSDSKSSNYDVTSPDYDGISDPESLTYDPGDLNYNPVVDYTSVEYDPDNPLYDSSYDVTTPKYIQQLERPEDLTESTEVLAHEAWSEFEAQYPSSDVSASTLRITSHEGDERAVFTGDNTLSKIDPFTGNTQYSLGKFHNLEIHNNVTDDYSETHYEIVTVIDNQAYDHGVLSALDPYNPLKPETLQNRFGIKIGTFNTASEFISAHPSMVAQAVSQFPGFSFGTVKVLLNGVEEAFPVTVDGSNNPNYSIQVTMEEIPVTPPITTGDTPVTPPITTGEVYAVIATSYVAPITHKESKEITDYSRVTGMVLKWNSESNKWVIRKSDLDNAKEYTDQQIRIAINGKAYVTGTVPVFHPASSSGAGDAYIEYTDELGVTCIGDCEARYYWTDNSQSPANTYVYLLISEDDYLTGEWLILDAADVNFTQFWSKQLDTVDNYAVTEGGVTTSWYDRPDAEKKTKVLSLFGWESALKDRILDKRSTAEAKNVAFRPAAANQVYELDQVKEDRMQFDNTTLDPNLNVPVASVTNKGRLMWYFGPVATIYVVDKTYLEAGRYATVEGIFPTVTKLNEVDRDSLFNTTLISTLTTYTQYESDGVTQKSTGTISNGEFSSSIETAINDVIVLSDGTNTYTWQVMPSTEAPGSLDKDNFYQCIENPDVPNTYYWKKKQMGGGDAYNVKYVSDYCQKAVGDKPWINGTKDIVNVGKALDFLFNYLFPKKLKILKFKWTFMHKDASGNKVSKIIQVVNTVDTPDDEEVTRAEAIIERGDCVYACDESTSPRTASDMEWEYNKKLQLDPTRDPEDTDFVVSQVMAGDSLAQNTYQFKNIRTIDYDNFPSGKEYKLTATDSANNVKSASLNVKFGLKIYTGYISNTLYNRCKNEPHTQELINDVIAWVKDTSNCKSVVKDVKAGTYTGIDAKDGKRIFVIPSEFGRIDGVDANLPVDITNNGASVSHPELITFDMENDYGYTTEYILWSGTKSSIGVTTCKIP